MIALAIAVDAKASLARQHLLTCQRGKVKFKFGFVLGLGAG
jgi:hypothetical protein